MVSFIARAHFHVQDQPGIGHEVGVQHVRGTAWFLRVVSWNGPLLAAIEHLDVRIHIQNPGRIEQGLVAALQMGLKPLGARGTIGLGKGPAGRRGTDHLAHPQQRGIDRVPTVGLHVRVAIVAPQHGQEQGAQYVYSLGRVIARVGQGTIGDPGRPQFRRLQKVNEKRQLSERCYRRLRVPRYMNPTAKGIQRNPPGQCRGRARFTFTQWVKQVEVLFCVHLL